MQRQHVSRTADRIGTGSLSPLTNSINPALVEKNTHTRQQLTRRLDPRPSGQSSEGPKLQTDR
jgi:hypothetical protein